MLKRAASAPDEIVTVEDSETRIVAAVSDVAMFSAAENEEDDVKVGAVASNVIEERVTGDALLKFEVVLRAHTR
jgi:hypothetical protein